MYFLQETPVEILRVRHQLFLFGPFLPCAMEVYFAKYICLSVFQQLYNVLPEILPNRPTIGTAQTVRRTPERTASLRGRCDDFDDGCLGTER
jgi:hypothetical protein